MVEEKQLEKKIKIDKRQKKYLKKFTKHRLKWYSSWMMNIIHSIG
jgi:hypothetical protein